MLLCFVFKLSLIPSSWFIYRCIRMCVHKNNEKWLNIKNKLWYNVLIKLTILIMVLSVFYLKKLTWWIYLVAYRVAVPCTVEPCLMVTSLIRSSCHYSHFFSFVPGKCPYISIKKNVYAAALLIWPDFHGLVVIVLTGFHCSRKQ